MKRIVLAVMLAALLTLVIPAPASASIHPIVASLCAKVAALNPNVLDPPGQTPASFDPNTWTQSNLRALMATGVLTLVRDADGNVIDIVFDDSLPAVKDGSFPAIVHCKNLNP